MKWQQTKDKIHYHTVNKNPQELPNNLLNETNNVMAYDIYLASTNNYTHHWNQE